MKTNEISQMKSEVNECGAQSFCARRMQAAHEHSQAGSMQAAHEHSQASSMLAAHEHSQAGSMQAAHEHSLAGSMWSARWRRMAAVMLLSVVGSVTDVAWATDYVHVMLGAADGSGRRPVTAKFVRTNRNSSGQLETSQLSPIVNKHRYYSAATDNGDGTFTVDESSEITSGNHFASDEVVTCYVTYDDYDHSLFDSDKPFRITLGDASNTASFSDKYWTATTSGIFSTSDGTYTNADLWTVTGDPYSMQFHPYSQSGQSLTLGDAGSGAYDANMLLSGTAFKLLPTATPYAYNQFYLTTYNSLATIRVNSSVDGNPIQNSESDGQHAGPNWYSNGTQLKAYRERKYSGIYFAKSDPSDNTRRFHILNSSGVQEALWEPGATFNDLSLRRFFQSPFCANYRYSSTSDMTGALPTQNSFGWLMDVVTDIYVKYDYDHTTFDGGTRSYYVRLKLNGSDAYHIGQPNDSGKLNHVRNDKSSASTWKIVGTPYAFRLRKSDDASVFISAGSLTNNSETIYQGTSSQGYDTFSATYSRNSDERFMIYVNPGAAVSVAETSRSALGDTNGNQIKPLRVETQPYSNIITYGDWNAAFEGSTEVTYHVVNLAGTEVVKATAFLYDGETLRVPDAIRSPLATGWTFYTSLSDAQSKTGAVTTGSGDIYVRYDYNNATSPVDLSGKTWYLMQFAEQGGRYIYDQDRTNHYSDCDRSTLLYGGEDYEQMERFYWTFTGGDPYDVSVVNKREPSMVLSKPATSTAAQRGQLKADGTSGTVQRFALIQNPLKSSYYELMGMYDSGTADTYYYLFNSGSQAQLRAVAPSGIVNSTLQLQLTPYRCYYIIDNTGAEAIRRMAPATTTLAVPDIIKSPLMTASQYRYYGSLSDATSGVNALDASNTPAHTHGDIYVRYDYNNATSPLDLSGATKYTWVMPSGGPTRFHYANSNVANRTYVNNNVQANATVAHGDRYRWALSGNDPYRITFLNSAYDERVLATNPGNLNHNSDQQLFMRLPADVTGLGTQHFLLTQGSGLSTYQILLADGRNHPTNNQAWDDIYYYMRNNNGDYPYFRADDRTLTDGAERTQHAFYHEPLYYAVVNTLGAIALDGYYLNHTATLEMMPELKTPYLPDDASYKFFRTQAQAEAYTKGESDGSAAITLVSETDGASVYIGYRYDDAARPAGLPSLQGTLRYYIRGYASPTNSATSYYYYTQNQSVNPPGGHGSGKQTRILSTTNPNESSGQWSNDLFHWTFSGNDPYAISVHNVFTGKTVNAHEGSYQLHASGTNNWGWDLDLDGTTPQRMVMLSDGGSRYHLAILSPYYGVQDGKHVEYWSRDSSNGLAQITRNDGSANYAYATYTFTPERYGSLAFEDVAPTYVIVNNAGNEVFRWKDSNPTLRVNEWVATPLATSYRFYTSLTAAQADASAGSEQTGAQHEGDAATNSATYYVRYSSASHSVKLDGSVWYKMQLRKNSPSYMYYAEGGDARLSTADSDDDTYLWCFTGNDPYDVHIENKVGQANHPGYMLTSRLGVNNNNGNLSGGKTGIKYVDYEAPNGESQSLAANMHLQSFFFVQDGDSKLHLAGAYNGYLYNADGSYNTNHGSQIYFLYAASAGDIYFQIERNNGNQRRTDGDAVSQLTLTPIYSVTYHLYTQTGTALPSVTMLVSSEELGAIPLPTALQRKYIDSYQFYSAYDGTQATYAGRYSGELTTMAAVMEAGVHDLYVKYNFDASDLPFDLSTDYAHARWYRMTAQGAAYTRWSGTQLVGGPDGLSNAVYTTDYQYAFFGDPYELRIMNRAGGDGRYLGVPTGASLSTDITPVTDGNIVTWEILPESADGTFQLRAFGTAAAPHYAGYTAGAAKYISESAMVLTAVALPQHKYTYHIIDNTGREAINATVTQDILTPITFDNLPATIASPYIADETITGYATATGGNSLGRSTYNLSNVISTTPVPTAEELAKAEAEKTPIDIYIRYTTEHLAKKTLSISGRRSYNVVQVSSTKYVYKDGDTTIGYNASATTDNKQSKEYLWSMTGNDPYAVQLQNVRSETYFTIQAPPYPPTFVLGAPGTTSNTNTFFIIMGGTTNPSDLTQVRMMSATGTSTTGVEELRFESNLPPAHYYVIDRQHKVVIDAIAPSSAADLELPDAIKSPFVAKYHYWKFSSLSANSDGTGTPDVGAPAATYYVKGGEDEITSIAEALGGGDIHIYCTYGTEDLVNPDMFAKVKSTTSSGTTTYSHVMARDESKDAPTYMIKYLNGDSFNQEDEADGFLSEKSQAMYPYNNGDGALYVYGEQQWKNQLAKAATTRGRWLWYIESETLDPYHVYVGSRQGNRSHFSYLRTYQPVDYDKIVTNVITGNTADVADGSDDSKNVRHAATEYMILGTPGHGRFVTVGTVALDKNHDGDTTDEGEGTERRTVTSFEQYWKNRTTAQNLLPDGKKVTTTGRNVVTTSEQKAILEQGQDGAGEQTWHSYNLWANSHPWVTNSDGSTGRQFGYEEHWFQTINMGTGEFALEEVSLTSTLILLDQHGWEIMRTNLPNGPTDPYKEQYYKEIHRFHSPMVARYHYWKNGSKVPGYHRFTVSDAATDAVTGGDYTTEVLGDYDSGVGAGNLPDWEANGALNRDWYVTYDVKEEYTNAYRGAATETATEASAYLVEQNSRFLTATDNSTLGNTTAPATYGAITDAMLFYLRPNFNIDREMGYLYLGEEGAKDEALSKAETDEEHYTAGHNGFDPYNVQLQSKLYIDRYVTTNATNATLDAAGGWTSTYASPTALSLKERDKQIPSVIGHDQASLNITNATFMVVDDGHGNMRLMPRFDHTRVMTSLSTLNAQISAADATQTLLLTHPMEVTYHVVNKSGTEAISYVDQFKTAGSYAPALPSFLKAYGTTNFKYYARSEFDPEPLTRGVYRLVNTAAPSLTNYSVVGDKGDIYVMYDLVPDKAAPGDANRSIADWGFDGTKMYNLKLRNTASPVTDQYLTYVPATTSVTAANTSLTADEKKTQENIWRITTLNGDPYQAQLYNFRNSDNPLGVSSYGSAPTAAGTETYRTFIITDWNSTGKQFELLAANSRTSSATNNNYYAYLTYSGGPKVLRSESRQHNETVASNLVGFTLEPVTLTFTYKLYDLAGNLTLQGSVSEVSDITPSLPDFMRSPLVADEDYSYWKDDARSTPLTTLSQTEGNTVYVSYVPLAPEEVALKLDGSQTYTFHTKLNASTLAMGENGQVSLRTTIGKRPNYYELTLHGREINGWYDPYDVAIFSPFQNRYWQSGNVNNANANKNDALSSNSQTVNSRFMILRGTTEEQVEYIQIAQKRLNGSTYYPNLTGTLKYIYHDGTNFYTGQGTTQSITHTDGETHQLHVLQPAHVYHILNLQGKEAVAGVEARLVKPSSTEPLLPAVIQSPIVKTYHYYDVTAFNINDGVYTLKPGASELEYLSDATTPDIYVVYTRADLDQTHDLNGSTVYNIIFGPDAFTQDGVTETLNSYFAYDAGITYRNATSDTNLESSKFQVTGSYYADPSSGAMASRYVVVEDESAKSAANAVHPESGSDASRWALKYLVEPELTTSQKEDNHYLWSFTGDDPYNLKLHSMTDPDKYVYRNGDAGGYTVGLTLGTTTNEVRSTYMLTGRGSGDATRFNIMASGPCTAGIAPYSYQYIGRSYNSNVHRNTRRGVVLQGFHEWGWSYTYNEALVTVKLVPQLEGTVTYIVIDKRGQEAVRMQVTQSMGIKPQLPTAIRSPYATNFQYWNHPTERAEGNKMTATIANAVIYVTYDADEDALDDAGIDLAGRGTGDGTSYNIQVNGMYLYNSNGSLVADRTPSKYDDTMHEWYLEGNASGGVDPYDVRLRSKQTLTQYIELATYNNATETNTLALIADNGSNNVQSFILMDGQPGKMELLAATKDKTVVSSNNRLAYLGYLTATQLLGVGSDDENPKYQSGMSQVQVLLRRPYSGVTYHIMNLSGTEAVRYTVEASKGDELEVPEQIKSPFVTHWRFWSDAACTAALTSVPDAYADVYVTYAYDDATATTLQLDGTRFYNMKVADRYMQEADGGIEVLEDETLDSSDANLTANLWSLDGTTGGSGIDPYNLRLLNKAYNDVYAGAPLSYANDTETTMQMSDGVTENFRSTFFLVGGETEGSYELVLASGENVTDNVLAYVNRHADDVINLNRDADYRHLDASLQIQFTSPVNQYLYKVYDRSGKLAIQAWGDGVAGAAPEIPTVIKSPLVSQFYYNVETLPYTTGVDEIAVTYDFDKDKLSSPNLLGLKAYNIKFRNDYFMKTGSGTDVATEYSETTTNPNLGTPDTGVAIWKPSAQFGGDGVEDIDPYCITLKHSNGKVLTASAITPGTNAVTLAEDNTANTYQRFILVAGNDDRYEFMAATGDKIGSTYGADGYDMFAYLAITDANEPTLARGEAYSRGKTSVQMELIPFQYTYTYIIVNNSGYEALRATAKQEGGDAPHLVEGLRSPLLNADEYVYYEAGAFSQLGSWHDIDGDGTDNKYVLSAGATEAATLPYDNTTIYVRYNYTPKAGGLDIGTASEPAVMKYQIRGFYNNNYNHYAYAQKSASGYTTATKSSAEATDHYSWVLSGSGDPYDINIRSALAGEDYILGYRGFYGVYDSQGWRWAGHIGLSLSNTADDGRFNTTRFAIVEHSDGDYRLMCITPWVWDKEWMESTVEATAADKYPEKGEDYTNMVNSFNFTTFTNNTNHYVSWYLDSQNYWKPGTNANPIDGTEIQFIPTTKHNYRFHLTTKIDGRKLIVEKPNTMARDVFEIPEELLRKYCDYTAKYYVVNDGSDADRRPVEKGTAGAVEKTIDLSDAATLYPFFQYIDNLSDAQKEDTWVDIYIDYHARQHYKTDEDDNYVKNSSGEYEIDPDGMPFNVMAWNAETVDNLLNNEAYTDYLFQINNYENLTEPLMGTTFGLQRKDYLYFMVLKTDNDFTTNNGQYFLRREDDGRISWLNNDYKIYKDAAKNYKGWNYSRCAEAYRDNDHSVFEEKKWLFCFAGDPYDFYVFNANSTVEETYNAITEQKEFVKTHRDHLVSYTTLTNTSGTTTEYAVNTPLYSETAPVLYRWGLAPGQGANSDETFSLITGRFTHTANEGEYKNPTLPNIDESPLYWRMDKSVVDNKSEVMLQTRAKDNVTPDYNIQVLPYEPTRFEIVRFIIRRDDEIDDDGTEDTYLGKYPKSLGEMIGSGDITPAQAGDKSQEMSMFIDALPSGTVRLYTSTGDRMFAHGDRITLDDLPGELRRRFCDYKFYNDDYRTEGAIESLPYCPVRGDIQRDGEGNIIYNSVGKAMYNYYAVNEETGAVIMVGPPGAQTPQGAPPKTIYLKYAVTTDKFLKKHPTRAQVEEMLANNDHVYFMDFADPNMLKGGSLSYNSGHHAYYEEEVTFEDQIGMLHEGVLAEKMIWNGSEFVYDLSQKFNFCRYKTTDNRMKSVPEDLKWYFVGDPYKLQVYNTEYVLKNNEPMGNLCRFDPTESSFQFVVDCVHFRTPDPSIIDERKTLIYLDADGNGHEVDNNNYGKPYYQDFYWEVVAPASDDPETFALRFRDDNQLLGYRDVFYYLAHDGIKRTYREAQSENPKPYAINLSYDPDNALNLKGKYKDFHAANDENCVIRLMQPAKVYFTAYKETYAGDPIVTEELSEYFGVGETLKEVPRHLQRKFVKYDNLQYEDKAHNWTNASFDFTLSEDKAFNLENCKDSEPVHTIDNEWVYQEGTKYDSNGDPVLDPFGNFILGADDYTKCRASYKFRVTYEVDDITKDDIHLFTTTAEFANAAVEPQWLDVRIGNNNWLYYDKTRVDADKESPTYRMENDTLRTSHYPPTLDAEQGASGWDTGLKGLHWAFIGDPYKFTVINRRRWEDMGSPRTPVANENFWLGTGYGQNKSDENEWENYTRLGDTKENRAYGVDGTGGNSMNGNTEWGLMMCKTGGAGDYFIRTASPKVSTVDEIVGDYTNSDSRNITNNYARIYRKDFVNENSSAVPAASSFVLDEFSLATKTNDIQKAIIRTAVAEDEDNANNDCFDATVRIYNINGELKATLEHVEVTYGDVVKSLPKTLKRYGCNYTECYQILYPGYTDAMLADPTSSATTARTALIQSQVASLNNFTGANKIGSLTTFTKENLDKTKMVTDLNGRKYIELAYVYEVDDDVAQFFTSAEDAAQEEYTWSNAYFQWDQIYKGTNVRVVSYRDVFDHYEYNADGHIVNEVTHREEFVEYKSGEQIATPAYGWMDTHDGTDRAYGDKRSQTDDNEQKWSFVGDPYDFELKNYAMYLDNTHTAMTADGTDSDDLNASNTDASHWAIVQGLQKTEIVNGKTVKVTDKNGDPVYVYYLALIDDETGLATKFVTFDRTQDNKDLSADEQNLYLKGNPVEGDPTGDFYSNNTKDVKPFYLADLLSYANWVVYHLVIAHQHSLDYTDAGLTDKQKLLIDQHLVEWLKYKYPTYMTTTTTTVNGTPYTKTTETIKGDYIDGGSAFSVTSGTTVSSQLTTAAKDEITEYLKDASLRDVVNDSIPDYHVSHVGIGNTLTVPWYMKRRFASYKLYQRDVLRSQTSDRIVYEADGVTPKTFIDENGVEQIAKEIDWVSVTADPSKSYYETVVAENGKQISKLNESHKNRMVVVDVVYEVKPEEFHFATEGESTTAWYSLLSQDESNGLVNFSYSGGIGARHGRATHYTNNYLWSPEGDPYGFVLHNRYATKNGAGWSSVFPTTTNTTFDVENGAFESTKTLNKTAAFTTTQVVQSTQTAHNAVYEMYAGNFDGAFLMHPTAAAISNTDEKFPSCYVVHDSATSTTNPTTLKYYADVKSIRSNRNANWHLMATPEQLLPYFERSGYVGGLKPATANAFENQSLYATLQGYRDNYRADLSVIDFTQIKRAQDLVYNDANLVPLTQGYYRIQGFSRASLDADDAEVDGENPGIQGPRYVSGYRHQSEKDYEGYTGAGDVLAAGSQPLHFFETDEEHTTLTTFDALNTRVSGMANRKLTPHPAHRGNIEMLAAEYDPASIFYFVPTGDSYGRYTFGTQDLEVSAGTGFTKLVNSGTGSKFRIDNIGGTAVTLRTLTDENKDLLETNLQTNYLCIDSDHRYTLTLNTSNEFSEIGDSYETGSDYWTMDDLDYGTQSTKWLLQPVGVQMDWPYNEKPLSVRVNEGGQKPNTSDGTGLSGSENKDNNYYGSLYVPFDARLSKTVDGAFTNIRETPAPYSISLTSVSQLNNMSNPQFIPAGWPVIIRTSKPVTSITKEDGSVMSSAPHVDLYLPNATKTSIPENFAKINLYGEYLEKKLTNAEIDDKTSDGSKAASIRRTVPDGDKNIMVVGLPFTEGGSDRTAWSNTKSQNKSLDYYAYDEESAVGFYTNENWQRGYYVEAAVANGAASASAFDALSESDKSLLVNAHWATARNATLAQRSNKYVYHNKAYFVHNVRPSGSGGIAESKDNYFFFLFDEDAIEQPEADEGDWETPATGTVTGVYDLSGRLLRTREAVMNGTWRRNLPPGMYIVNGRKMTVK